MSRLLALVYDRFTAGAEEACFAAWRRDLLAGVGGEVLEIGAGTGRNLTHYPATVTRLVLTEPDAAMRRRLIRRLDAVRAAGSLDGVTVEIRDDGVDRLGFDDGSFDVVVSTLVLCSVPDQPTALREVRRVLRPGGRLVFLEHVAAEGNPDRSRRQRRVEPVWKRVAGGCHLTRRTADAVAGAGFTLDEVTRESARKTVPVLRPTVRGTATVPAGPEPG